VKGGGDREGSGLIVEGDQNQKKRSLNEKLRESERREKKRERKRDRKRQGA
jgi:hypothetical protein